MQTSQEIIQQAKKWMINDQFLQHTAYSIEDLAAILDKDERFYGYITARAKAPEPYRGFAVRWEIVLTNKRLIFLSKGDGKTLYVDSVISKWEIPLENILSVKKKGILRNKIIVYPYKDVIKNIPNETIDPFYEALNMAIKNACKY